MKIEDAQTIVVYSLSIICNTLIVDNTKSKLIYFYKVSVAHHAYSLIFILMLQSIISDVFIKNDS